MARIISKGKKIAEIYFNDEYGETTVVWKDNTLSNLKCYPTCFLDLKTDIYYALEKKLGATDKLLDSINFPLKKNGKQKTDKQKEILLS
jgi:hypothetical protein